MLFEYPANEDVRSLMRLETLFRRFDFYLSMDDRWFHHFALNVLFEISDLGSRSIPKRWIMLEFARIIESLKVRDCEPEKLELYRNMSSKLLSAHSSTAFNLRGDEWLLNLKKRSAIAGEVCEFDFPNYFWWLRLPPEERRADLVYWFLPMKTISEAVDLFLKTLRVSVLESKALIARSGHFSEKIQNKMIHLIQLEVHEGDFTAEFTANRHELHVEFLRASKTQESARPRIQEDISFHLTYLTL